MAVQASATNTTVPFIRSGDSLLKDNAIIKQDAGRSTALAPFTVLGILKNTIATTGTAAVGNTGDGTVTAVAKLAGKSIITGSYNLECTAAVLNGAVFKLEDPYGGLVADGLVMTTGAGAATIFNAGGITFTITDGAVDFIVGDKFALVVTGDGDYKPLDPDDVNGAAEVAGVYLGDSISAAKIVAGDVPDNPVLVGGACTVDGSQIVFENSLTVNSILPSGKTVREELALLGIFVEDTIDIDGFEN